MNLDHIFVLLCLYFAAIHGFSLVENNSLRLTQHRQLRDRQSFWTRRATIESSAAPPSDIPNSSDVTSLRSITFTGLTKEQEPQLLCNLLMELGACSTSITDADAGTDSEHAIFDEPEGWTTSTAVTTHVWNLCNVQAHFPASTDLEWIMEIVQEAFANEDGEAGLPTYDRIEVVEDKDWVLHVQQSWKPIVLPPFVLRFPWHSDEVVRQACQDSVSTTRDATPSFLELELQGGIAFGTGEHPTTQLCLDWIAQNVKQLPETKLVMDYGSGSGVLGMAACKLSPDIRAIGVDIDVDAVQIANANAEQNKVNMQNYLSDLIQESDENEHVPDGESQSLRLVKAFSSSPDATAATLPQEWNGPMYDLVVANILAGPLCSLAPTLAGLAKAGGRMGLSGIMTGQAETVRQAYLPYFDDVQVEQELGGWVLITGIRKEA